MRTSTLVALCCALSTLAGCQSFALTAPANFVELEEPGWSQYALRATNADGVVVAVREVDDARRGSLGFWSQAIRNRLRDSHAYALLDERTVHAASGEEGVRLRFGRDEGQQPYDYELALYVQERSWPRVSRVFVVEMGGPREAYGKVSAALDDALSGFTIR